jgi:hypothetical protein
MNEYRQTKEYDGRSAWTPSPGFIKAQNDAVKQIMAQQIDEETEKVTPDPAPFNLEDQIQEIAEIVAPTIHDVIFNEIIEVMDNYDELNWGYFVQDDAPVALLDACFDHKTEIHYEIFQIVLQKLK